MTTKKTENTTEGCLHEWPLIVAVCDVVFPFPCQPLPKKKQCNVNSRFEQFNYHLIEETMKVILRPKTA